MRASIIISQYKNSSFGNVSYESDPSIIQKIQKLLPPLSL